jgi:hypothetical protein
VQRFATRNDGTPSALNLHLATSQQAAARTSRAVRHVRKHPMQFAQAEYLPGFEA